LENFVLVIGQTREMRNVTGGVGLIGRTAKRPGKLLLFEIPGSEKNFREMTGAVPD
jgi:hypothetical protein